MGSWSESRGSYSPRKPPPARRSYLAVAENRRFSRSDGSTAPVDLARPKVSLSDERRRASLEPRAASLRSPCLRRYLRRAVGPFRSPTPSIAQSSYVLWVLWRAFRGCDNSRVASEVFVSEANDGSEDERSDVFRWTTERSEGGGWGGRGCGKRSGVGLRKGPGVSAVPGRSKHRRERSD